MRSNLVLLCGYLAWPCHPHGTNRTALAYGPTIIPTAASVESAEFALAGDAQRWGSIVRYRGQTYTVPHSLLATPAERK